MVLVWTCYTPFSTPRLQALVCAGILAKAMDPSSYLIPHAFVQIRCNEVEVHPFPSFFSFVLFPFCPCESPCGPTQPVCIFPPFAESRTQVISLGPFPCFRPTAFVLIGHSCQNPFVSHLCFSSYQTFYPAFSLLACFLSCFPPRPRDLLLLFSGRRRLGVRAGVSLPMAARIIFCSPLLADCAFSTVGGPAEAFITRGRRDTKGPWFGRGLFVLPLF